MLPGRYPVLQVTHCVGFLTLRDDLNFTVTHSESKAESTSVPGVSRLFGLLVVAPVIELMVFIAVGRRVGFGLAVVAVLAMAMAGIFVIRIQGALTLSRAFEGLRSGQSPALDVARGAVLALAGLLFLAPGFLSDLVGVALLVPPVRHRVAQQWVDRVQPAARRGPTKVKVKMGKVIYDAPATDTTATTPAGSASRAPDDQSNDVVIELPRPKSDA
jgi:UPF0716 protein FxsA